MDTPVTRAEHEEFRHTVDAKFEQMHDEDHRQNRRIELLEENVLEIGQLTATVSKLAMNMESVIKTQEQQEKRLKSLEDRDGEKWRQVTGYIITVVVGIVIGYIFKQFGM